MRALLIVGGLAVVAVGGFWLYRRYAGPPRVVGIRAAVTPGQMDALRATAARVALLPKGA